VLVVYCVNWAPPSYDWGPICCAWRMTKKNAPNGHREHLAVLSILHLIAYAERSNWGWRRRQVNAFSPESLFDYFLVSQGQSCGSPKISTILAITLLHHCSSSFKIMPDSRER
jgi:hypothetical protein